MIDLFNAIYGSIKDKNEFLKRIRFYSFLRLFVRLLANIILPFNFILTQRNSRYSLSSSISDTPKYIVSLTSFPSRIDRLWLVIESLLRQQFMPDKIILWLSKEQFSDLDQLPKRLTKLMNRGLEIRLCEDNLRSHKKYYYALREFPNDNIITFDDDVFYNSNVLRILVEQHLKFPEAICCNEASKIKIDKDRVVSSYVKWENVKAEQFPIKEIIPIGVGGVLYPPNSLHSEVFNISAFKKHCFFADDIWLNMMAHMHNTKITKSSYDLFFLPVMNYRNKTLNSQNINEGLNDSQLADVRSYCIHKLGNDPLENIYN